MMEKRMEDIMQGENKRHNQRDEFRHSLEVRVSATRETTAQPIRRAQGIDISSGGVGLQVHDELSAGELIQLFVPLDGSAVKIPVFAEVRWVASHEEKYRVGLRFLA